MRWILLTCCLSGCLFTPIETQCPKCTIVSRLQAPPPVADDTLTVYLLVPGILGFGWEWDDPLIVLRTIPQSVIEVFDWSPWSPLQGIAEDLALTINRIFTYQSINRVVVIAHSAGGLAAARAAALVEVPVGKRVEIVNVGAPYAGLEVLPFDGPPDFLWSPLPLAIGHRFERYPAPAARVTVESFVTRWPPDDVMKPRFGHDPGDPRVGPPGPRRPVPTGTDHNHVLASIARVIRARDDPRPTERAKAQPPFAPAETTRSRPAFLAR